MRIAFFSINRIFALTLLVVATAFASPQFDLAQLQGAWWSDPASPTADFAISADQVWVDSDAQYRPCKIEGDVLVFDLGEAGIARNRIIRLDGDELVLEDVETRQRVTLKREK